jgi:predicted NBD/HSP70 family sugar kinase
MNQLIDFLPAEHYFNIEHDINAQALSVIHLHKWTYNNYVFLHFGEGIGMTFYNHGLYSGSRGLAGEIGHVPFNRLPKDRICDCGRKNCFETFLSVKGVLQLIHDFCGIKLKNLNEVDQSIISNSALNDFMKEAVSYILIFIKNILDPEQIIIGGEALEPFLPVIKTKIENKVNQESWLSGNNIIKWYSDKEINCAYGTVMTSCDKMIEQHIINNLI